MSQQITNMIAELPTISKLLFIIFLAFLLQALAGFYQFRNYRDTMRRLHKLGNVGIGQKKGRFFNGNIVMVACDNEGWIKRVEILDGLTFLAKFHVIDEFLDRKLVGSNVYDFLEITDEFDKKQRKKYMGWVRAFEAIRMRFEEQHQKAEEEAELEESVLETE